MNVMNAQLLDSSAFQHKMSTHVIADYVDSTISTGQNPVRALHHCSKWLTELQDRLKELSSLPKGWDGYAGRSVSFPCVYFTAQLIEQIFCPGVPAPDLVPGGDGTLQIEWHRNQYDVEIDVLAPYHVVASRFDHLSQRAEEIILEAEFSKLAEWVADLQRNREQAVPLEA